MTIATSSSPAITTSFAQNLLVARQAREWTQRALADAAGLSRATVAQLEAGTGDPKLSTVEQLAAALGVSPLLLLLGPLELQALADRSHREWPATVSQHPSIQTMKHLLSTGLIRSRLEAANMGIHLARNAGIHPNIGAVLGAAIGSFHLPGAGTLAASSIGQLLATDRSDIQ